jgi:hypothetical protein
MFVSYQQKIILQAATTARGPIRPKHIVEETGMGYNTVSPQLERLAAKTILVKAKEDKPPIVTDESRPNR